MRDYKKMKKFTGFILSLMVFTACLQDDDYSDESYFKIINEYPTGYNQKGAKVINDSIISPLILPQYENDEESDTPKGKEGNGLRDGYSNDTIQLKVRNF